MRMIGYTCMPFCGKDCCRNGVTKNAKRAESKTQKQREKRTWKRELDKD